jgi:hypothetical protein
LAAKSTTVARMTNLRTAREARAPDDSYPESPVFAIFGPSKLTPNSLRKRRQRGPGPYLTSLSR